jgi:hypothetical protein
MFTEGLNACAFKLGAKGTLGEIEYEIIGRIRYQDEDEWEVDVWDEWLAVASDGTYHWFVEEEGRVYAYEEYVPSSMNLELSEKKFEFEGRQYSKEAAGFVARIVYAEGELTWKPEIGEPMQCYDFNVGKAHYTIEISEDEVSVNKGRLIPYRKIIMAFSKEEFLEKYERTIWKRKQYKKKAVAYAVFGLLSLALSIHGCFSGNPIPAAFDRSSMMVLLENLPKQEENNALYFSQILFTKGVELKRTDMLYELRLEIDPTVQQFSREWMSCRFLLIGEAKYRELMMQAQEASATKSGQAKAHVLLKPGDEGYNSLADIFEDVELLPEPAESLAVEGDFWDEEGYDDEGHWHESDTLMLKDFILDQPGTYYAYLEMYSQNPRNPRGVRVTMMENVRGYRYYVIVFFILLVLCGINIVRARTYNELPFPVAEE